MSATRARVNTLAGIALASALVFTACSGVDQNPAADDTDIAETADLRSDAVAQLESGSAEILDQVPDLEFNDVVQDDSTVVSAFDKELRVQKTVQTTTLPAAVAEQMTGISGEFEPDDLVEAADGEVIVITVLQADDPRWEPTGAQLDNLSPTETVLRVGGNPVTSPHIELESGDQITLAVAVPEGPQPGSVTVEMLQDDVSQELSLVDGTRISSDVEHIYDRPTTVTIGDGASWSEEGESRRGVIIMSGQLTDGVITPFVPAHGWANPGNVFLGLNLTTQGLEGAHRDHSSIRLQLADGTTVQTESQTRGTDGPFSKTAWFQLPVDASEATALIGLEMALGTDQYDVAEIEVPLTISTENTDSAEAHDAEDDPAEL